MNDAKAILQPTPEGAASTLCTLAGKCLSKPGKSYRPTGAKFHESTLSKSSRVEDNGVILSFTALISTKLEAAQCRGAVCAALPSAGSFACVGVGNLANSCSAPTRARESFIIKV